MHILLEGLPDVVATQDASEVYSAAEEPVKFLAQNDVIMRSPLWVF